MSKLHYILPMGGAGTRFFNNGITVPKPLIELNGKPFFYWAAQSVLKFYDVSDMTCVILLEHAQKYSLDKEIKKYFPDAKIVYLDHVLNGAVLTCLEGVKGIEDDGPVLFNDCDHAFYIKGEDRTFIAEKNDDDGAIVTFESDNPAFSYVELDDNGNVCRTVEKEVVSNQAICGAYYFKNRTIFENMADEYFDKCQYKEFFVSGVYNVMAQHSLKIKSYPLDLHITFGTPDEYYLAENRSDEFKLFLPDSCNNTSV